MNKREAKIEVLKEISGLMESLSSGKLAPPKQQEEPPQEASPQPQQEESNEDESPEMLAKLQDMYSQIS